MDGRASADGLLIEAGTSSELAAAFEMLSDATGDDGPRHAPKVCRDVARAICCRTYASGILELCHFLRMAERASPHGYEHMMWGMTTVRASAFREAFGGTGSVGVEADGFMVAFSRMPFLAALLEFLVSTVGYAVVDAAVRPLLALGGDASVSEQANELSRAVYAYLKDHLPTAQVQRKFRALVAFLECHAGTGFSRDDVDDDAVLAFWRGGADDTEGGGDGMEDFRTFRSAFLAFVRLRQALGLALDKRAVRFAASIGGDREAGEVDPASLLAVVETVEEEANPLRRLAEPPASTVKFLNGKETAALDLLFECGTEADALPLSWLRAEVFGRGQARLTQAGRRKLTPSEMAGAIVASVDETYEGRRAGFVAGADHLDRVLMAGAHALLGHRDPMGGAVLLALRPDLDLAAVRDALGETPPGNVVALRQDDAARRAVEILAGPEHVDADVAEALLAARQAYLGIARQGFRDEDQADPDVRAGLAAGAEAVLAVRGRVRTFGARLDGVSLPAGGWDGQFAADKEVFLDRFAALYRGTL